MLGLCVPQKNRWVVDLEKLNLNTRLIAGYRLMCVQH
jgi:hypothetical protein